jgi:predicted Co/Zn/Cd cation transporter (cation efflux family)
MTSPFQIRASVQELRREIAEIKAADNVGHHSGVEKLKHEKRIERLQQIRDELLAMIAKHGMVSLLTLSVNQTRNANESHRE